jgi:hypothetical protein
MSETAVAPARRLPRQRFVQIVHIRLVMPPVMDLHRPRVDKRLQRVHRVRQLRQRVRTGRGLARQ